MKHLYSYIVGFFLLFNNIVATQAKIILPEDFDGSVTKSKVESINNEDESSSLTRDQLISITYESCRYIANKYTFEDVASDDFIEVLRKVFPDATEIELQNRHIAIRNVYAVYEFARETYNKYIEKRLHPKTIKRVHSDDDFDHPNEVPYMEAKEGHFIKVYNFKKFLTYSHNPDERQAITEYQARKAKGDDIFDKLDYMFHKVDWKKVWFYGSVFENPLLSKLGVGQLQKGKNFSIQLLSRNTYIDNNEELDFGFLLQNEIYTFILANNLSETQQKPEIDLTGSENVAEYQVLYPAPLNAENIPFAHKYFGDFLLPFKVKPIDVTKPVNLKASIKLTSCSTFFECITEDFHFQMTLEPSGDDFLPNGYDNLFAQTLKDIPQPQSDQLQLTRFVIDEINNEQIARLEFKSSEKIRNFKAFIEETDGYTKFSAPYINLKDNKVSVRFEIFPDDKNTNLINSEFIVTAVLNGRYYYRNKLFARSASEFDPQKPTLNFALLVLAVLGGLILNFMPCVFPVLSLKIMSSMKQAEKLRKRAWRKAIITTILGIFCGFTILIAMLLFAKYLGYSLGWGMQFQNMEFLVVMTFVLSSFIILMPYLKFDTLSNFVMQKKGSKMNFLIGNLIVLLSTPCTGPYLATAVGFALSGSYTDIIFILYAVALGLSLPYILLLKLKNPKSFLPKPGKWMQHLYLITQIMLYLTILWFFTLIAGQTGWLCLIKILSLLMFFLGFFYIYQRFLDYLNRYKEAPVEILNKIRRGTHLTAIVVFILVSVLASYIANQDYKTNYENRMFNRKKDIDIAEIQGLLNKGHPVLVEIKADWCMTCQANNFLMFNKFNLQRWESLYNLKYIQVDWTNYNEKVLDFMSRYGRKGLPFYVLYTPYIREGLVLPEIFSNDALETYIQDNTRR